MPLKIYTERHLNRLLEADELESADLGLPEGRIHLSSSVPTPHFKHGFGANLELDEPMPLVELLDEYSDRVYELINQFGALVVDEVEDSPELPGEELMDVLHTFHTDGPFHNRLEPWVVTCLSLHPKAKNRDGTQVMPMDDFAAYYRRKFGIRPINEKNPYTLVNKLHEEYEIANHRKMKRMEQVQREIFIDSLAGFTHPWAKKPRSVLMFLAEASKKARRALHARLFTPNRKDPGGVHPRLIGRFLGRDIFPEVLDE